MAQIDIYYKQLLEGILEHGYEYTTENRKGIRCKQISSVNISAELTEFPMITTKQMYSKGIVGELIWFLRGDTNIKWLDDNKIYIWHKDAYQYYSNKDGKLDYESWKLALSCDLHGEFGDVGRNYGAQWIDWTATGEAQFDELVPITGINQFQLLIDNLRKDNPMSRRHIVTAWNPAEIDDTALPPCHWSFEIIPRPLQITDKIRYSGGDLVYLEALWDSAYLKKDDEAKEILHKELAHLPDYGFTLKWNQRSVDTFLGLPFNIASYAVLAMIIGRMTGIKPLEIIGNLSNVHIYENHFDAVKEQIKNSPILHKGCGFEITSEGEQKFKEFDTHGSCHKLFNSLDINDFIFPGYESFDRIPAEMITQDDSKN